MDSLNKNIKTRFNYSILLFILTISTTLFSHNLYAVKCIAATDGKRAELHQIAIKNGLTITNTDAKGITRVQNSDGTFSYLSPTNKAVTNKKHLERINELGIPADSSGYSSKNIWISNSAHSHIQAIAVNSKGKTQYYYHKTWVKLSSEFKFNSIKKLGKALPTIRKKIEVDLSTKAITKEKLTALIVYLTEATLIRIGQQSNAKDYNTFGLTTLRISNKHIKVNGNNITFSFVGKKSVEHEITISEPSIAPILKTLLRAKGSDNIFKYKNENGQWTLVNASMVNSYLKEISGQEISIKDYRTWIASTTALQILKNKNPNEGQTAIKETMEEVSETLHNTPAVAQSSYVHPGVVSYFLDGKPINKLFTGLTNTKYQSQTEKALLKLIQ